MRVDKLKIYAPAVLLALIGFVIACQFVDPAAPSLPFSAGQKSGAYYTYAERYRDYLKQFGISVRLLESAGSVENVRRLKSDRADIVFAHSGIVSGDNKQLQSLGSMYYEPLWVFVRRGLDVHLLRDLKGRRIAIGTQALSMQLLTENGVDAGNSTLLSYDSATATGALLQGKLDALFADAGGFPAPRRTGLALMREQVEHHE